MVLRLVGHDGLRCIYFDIEEAELANGVTILFSSPEPELVSPTVAMHRKE